ncbi:MAG: single-stranded DNA-binding protein [Akkermansiaceae bacterium]|nr:single-stranded DNA-binding protein [Akkermansiaceae bacterium]NJR43673.1 single-stranded DNA-binding protein [Akkermansiaceae bacterium]
MANLNKVMLIGNLTRDPELRHTPKGTAVSEISLAINRVWKDDSGQKQEDTTFVEVTLWGRQAELAQQYLTKGRPVYIEGRLQLDSWDDKETGKKRSKIRVIAENMQFLGGGSSGSPGDRSSQTSRPAAQNYSSPQGATAATADEYQEDDDIPF